MSSTSHSDSTIDSLYPYDPSVIAAIIFIVAFSAVLIVKLLDYYKFRQRISTTRFPFLQDEEDHDAVFKQARKEVSSCLIPICLGFFFQSLGFAMRIISVSGENRDSLILYIIPTCFTLVSPSLMSAGIFMVFTRLEKFTHSENFSVMPSRFLTVFFVTGDIVSFLLQAGGGAMMASEGSRQIGSSIGLVGFGLQIFFFGFFIVVASIWYWRMEKKLTPVGTLIKMNRLGVRYNNWKPISLAMVGSMVLILIRCVLRIIEFSEMATDSTLLSHSELAYYMIDPFVVFWSCVVLVAIRPEYRLWDLKTYQVRYDSGKGFSETGSVELEEVEFSFGRTLSHTPNNYQDDSSMNWKSRDML